MSLYANLNDKIIIDNTECTVIGISVMSYKEKNEFYTNIEYKLSKDKDKSIWYLLDNIRNNIYILFSKINENIPNIHFYRSANAEKNIIKQYLVLSTKGNTDFNQKQIITYNYKASEHDFTLYRNKIKYYGIRIWNGIQKKANNINDNNLMNNCLPIISKFHDDNKIKNKAYKITNGFTVGDGLLINEQEHFVLSQSISLIKDETTYEYKLFNNNTRKYCWIKQFDKQYYLFNNCNPNQSKKILAKGEKQRISKLADFETLNNTKCKFFLFRDYNGKIFLEENWQNSIEYYQGEAINFGKILLLKYEYNIPNPFNNAKIRETKSKIIFSVIISYIIEIILYIPGALLVCILFLLYFITCIILSLLVFSLYFIIIFLIIELFKKSAIGSLICITIMILLLIKFYSYKKTSLTSFIKNNNLKIIGYIKRLGEKLENIPNKIADIIKLKCKENINKFWKEFNK